MAKNKETNNGKKGGTLKGKPHYDKNGKSVGGIKAVVTDTNQVVELEGGEVIINKEASKKHWKELSRINQSAGNGVPILPPDEVLADVDEYKNGGNIIEFNPNNLPSRWVMSYAKKIKEKYPKVWALGGNEYGNQAFTNLEAVLNRGYWLDSEEWFYYKWQSFCARHRQDFRIEGVIANIKWANRVEKGWQYMKKLVEEEIEKQYGKKMEVGGELAKGIEVEKEHTETIQEIYDHKITPEEAPKEIAKDHIEEDDHYYTKLAQMEGMREGGKVAKVMREFKEGILKTSYGELVTDKNQALAIALSEQRRYEQKKELGGKIDCDNCGHSWHKFENQSENIHVCHKCGHDNSKRYDVYDNSTNVKIKKIDKMEKSNVFYNGDIFKSNTDYILGGFNADDLNGITVKGDDALVSFAKLEYLFEKRLRNAIEKFKEEVKKNIITSGRTPNALELDAIIFEEFKVLFETYLGFTPSNITTDSLLTQIKNDTSYTTWLSRIKDRVDVVKSQITLTDIQSTSEENKSVTVADAEDKTYNTTLEEILEQLHTIIEENTY